MEKLTLNKQKLGLTSTTAIHLDVDTFLKVEKCAILTGKRKSEILGELVEFALAHAEIGDTNMKKEFDLTPCAIEKNDTEVREPQESGTTYKTITEVSKMTGLANYYLRNGIKTNTIPHIRCGRRILINLPRLLENLRAEEN